MKYDFENLFFCYTMLTFFVFLILISLKKNYNNNWLDINSTNTLKGIAIITVIFHHFATNMKYNSIFKIIFGNIGFLGVAIFLFVSGYGLLSSYKNNHNYLEKFLKNRFFKIIIIFIISRIIILLISRNIVIATQSDWYTYIILYYYFLFYMVYKYIKNNNLKKYIMWLSFIPYILICLYLKKSPYWYNTSICFPFGLLIAEYKEIVYKVINNNFIKFLIPLGLFILVMVVFQVTGFISNLQWLQFITPIIFILLIITLLTKFKLDSKILKFFSNISFPLYLLHIFLFKYIYNLGIHSDFVFVITIVVNILFAIIINKLLNIIYGRSI